MQPDSLCMRTDPPELVDNRPLTPRSARMAHKRKKARSETHRLLHVRAVLRHVPVPRWPGTSRFVLLAIVLLSRPPGQLPSPGAPTELSGGERSRPPTMLFVNFRTITNAEPPSAMYGRRGCTDRRSARTLQQSPATTQTGPPHRLQPGPVGRPTSRYCRTQCGESISGSDRVQGPPCTLVSPEPLVQCFFTNAFDFFCKPTHPLYKCNYTAVRPRDHCIALALRRHGGLAEKLLAAGVP